MTTNIIPTAYQLARLLSSYRVSHVVVSPGSRNAPIILALAGQHFKMHYVVDERSAAFVALGISVALDKPVAIVCTSGSAVLNYGPALAEANYSSIPLIAISADRPYYDIECNCPQTIRQNGVLDNIVRCSVDIRQDDSQIYTNKLINKALRIATERNGGPVHINMQFEMPLTAGAHEYPYYQRTETSVDNTYPHFSDFDSKKKYLLLIGGMRPDRDTETCGDFLKSLPANFAVIAEAQSNLSQYSTVPAADFDNAIDKIEWPDVVFVAGSPLVSAALNRFIKDFDGPCVHIDPVGRHYDYGVVNSSLIMFLALGLRGLNEARGRIPSYKRKFASVKPSQPSSVSRLVERLSGMDIMLHLSNGMTIREAQKVRVMPPTSVWANRGVSGIEGSVSTAIGSAAVSERPVVLVCGDMSAAYDVAALAIKETPSDFTMIVVNNNGGDIFRHVATTRDLPLRETFFTAMPKFPLEELAKAYGFDWQSTCDPDAITLSDGSKPKIIELIINE